MDASQIVEFQLKLIFQKVLHNQANRIWIFFDDSLTASIHSQSDQFLSIKFDHNALATEFLATFVHAHCTQAARATLWDDLSQVCAMNIPGVIYDDFNVIVSAEEKRGGCPFQVSDSTDFINFISSNSLLDAGFSGASYTWCNNRAGKARIWKRLDRIFLNPQWISLNLNNSVAHLARVGSDHAPLLAAHSQQSKPKCLFRF